MKLLNACKRYPVIYQSKLSYRPPVKARPQFASGASYYKGRRLDYSGAGLAVALKSKWSLKRKMLPQKKNRLCLGRDSYVPKSNKSKPIVKATGSRLP